MSTSSSSSITRLHLVGAIHRDPDGDRALTAMLIELAPRLISVEIAPYAIDFRRREGGRLERRLEDLLPAAAERLERTVETVRDDVRVAAIRATIALPYEYVAAERYGLEQGIPVHAIDDDDRARARLEALENDLLSLDGLCAFLAGASGDVSLAARANEQYALARRYLRMGSYFAYHFRKEELEDLETRAEGMASRIEALVGGLDASLEGSKDGPEPTGSAAGDGDLAAEQAGAGDGESGDVPAGNDLAGLSTLELLARGIVPTGLPTVGEVMGSGFAALASALKAKAAEQGGAEAALPSDASSEGLASPGQPGGPGASRTARKAGLVHVGGWEQLVDTDRIKNLTARLKGLNPVIRLVS